ncbi:hypothetical protein, partial [Sphingobium sp.]|uniref:hypothetical protein n=1 Tax=Sphingobium sp. TaxID=1912891 RepID=UPI00261E4884
MSLACHFRDPATEMVTPTGTRQSLKGIDLTPAFARSNLPIPSQVPTVQWDCVVLNDAAGN